MIRTICMAVAMAVAGVQASAAVMKAEYTGIVPAEYSYDTTGIFIDPGTRFNGEGFTLKYIYDTNLGTKDVGYGPIADAIAGGSGLGIVPPAVSPLLYASLMINGRSYEFYTAFIFFAVLRYDWSSYSHYVSDNRTSDQSNSINAFANMDRRFAPGFLAAGDLTTPIELTPAACDENDRGRCIFYLKEVSNGSVLYETYGQLYPTHLSIVECRTVTECIDGPDPSPVPLPASVAMLLAALGGLGALRRLAA